MPQKTFKPNAYLKEGCPYSFKYLLFMTEAGLLNQVDVIRCDPESAEFDVVNEKLSKADPESRLVISRSRSPEPKICSMKF